LAVLDIERNAVVIRIIYDGPPEAGKTTSLRALSASLARPMITPGEEGARTLFFDWMEYTGGLFEGHQIRCQIVTVPGQAVLAHRRHGLLETADVVVFVSDSTPAAVETTKTYLREMRTTLDRQPGPRIGVILQANKRDLPNAVDLATLRTAAAEPGMTVLESVATEGRGVRETFVFAVRLALDRVREDLRNRTLRLVPPEVQDSRELLRQIEGRESERTIRASYEGESSLASQVLQELMDDEIAVTAAAPRVPATTAAGVPRSPDDTVPSGMIWPPIDGRTLLHEACVGGFTPREVSHGDWVGESAGWRFHSPSQASYRDPELGRRSLIEWARLHAAGHRWFSTPRAVALAPTGHGDWRLWQTVKTEPSLRDLLVRGIQDGSPAALLRRLLDVGRILLEATEILALAPCRLSLTIDTVGAQNGRPLYVGFLPDPMLVRAPRPLSVDERSTLLRRELGTLASAELREHRPEAFPVLRSLVRETDPPVVVEAIYDVLLDSGLGSSEGHAVPGGAGR
jgi:signal recognition particle receptor subunit beta